MLVRILKTFFSLERASEKSKCTNFKKNTLKNVPQKGIKKHFRKRQTDQT